MVGSFYSRTHSSQGHQNSYYREKVTKSLGHIPTSNDIALAAAMPLRQVQELKGWLHADGCISLSLPAGSDSSLEAFIDDRSQRSQFYDASDSIRRDETLNILRSLTPRQEKVIRRTFGIGCERPHSPAEIGLDFDLSARVVSRIRDSALNKMKELSRTSWGREIKELI